MTFVSREQRDDLVTRMSDHLAAVGFHLFGRHLQDTRAISERIERQAWEVANAAAGDGMEASFEDAPEAATQVMRLYVKSAGELLRAEALRSGTAESASASAVGSGRADLGERTGEAGTSKHASESESESESDEESATGLASLIRKLALRQAEKEAATRGDDAEPSAPPALASFDVAGIAKYIKSGGCRNIIFMAGAGISVSAGIPDFRTPGTGLYDNLQKYNLPHPTAVFELDYFEENPKPFYLLAKELYPGQYPPTPTHHFVHLLHKKGLLLRCFTQNIDSLEAATGLPLDKIVAAHGNFDTAHCLNGHEADVDEVKDHVDRGEVMRCGCGALVKPDIVFFGENLPARFCHRAQEDFPKCDLLIVAGTSLAVQPFAGLINHPRDHVPRFLVNREKVGEMDERMRRFASLVGSGVGFDFGETNTRDALFLGDCDAGFMELAALLGWEDELRALVEAGRG